MLFAAVWAFGYVFRNCSFTGNAADGSFYLGRPWRPYAKVLIINSQLSSIVHKAGWDNWGNPANEATTFYAEYNNSGAGASTTHRVSWAKMITTDEAKKLNTVTILSGWDPWKWLMMADVGCWIVFYSCFLPIVNCQLIFFYETKSSLPFTLHLYLFCICIGIRGFYCIPVYQWRCQLSGQWIQDRLWCME